MKTKTYSFTSHTSYISGNMDVEPIEGSGIPKTVKMEPLAFDHIKSMGPVSVDFTFSDTPSIEITADDNLVDLIDLSCLGNTLYVDIEKSVSFTTQSPILVTIASPNLMTVDLKGSGRINIANLAQETFGVFLNGSGKISLSGNVQAAYLTLNGSGDIDAFDLTAANVEANLHGSGNIDAHATESVAARLTGSGDIKISGSPLERYPHCTGSGDIRIR